MARTGPAVTMTNEPIERLAAKEEHALDLGDFVRPLLEALATLSHLESTYLTVFDWETREQEVRFVFSAGPRQVEEGLRIPLPPEWTPEAFAGVTKSPLKTKSTPPDSLVSRGLGLQSYVSVPVTIAKHRLFGMLCGASQEPRELSETVVSMFESLAGMMADHVTRLHLESTEKRAIAAESQLLVRARSIAEAEHRLKTPLTILQGICITLRAHGDGLSDADRDMFLDSMLKNVRSLSEDVEHLLLESRAEIRIRELAPKNLDLAPLIRDITRAFDGLDSTHDVRADVPDRILAFVDADAIYQVIAHLLDNAIKYSPGGGRITTRAFESVDGVTIEVCDEGIGIPASRGFFKAYHRGDFHDGETPGIGLGLHIVEILVEGMDGTILVRENQGQGCTFTVTLPPALRSKTPPKFDLRIEHRKSLARP